jgi:exodeoxyribonuclease-3
MIKKIYSYNVNGLRAAENKGFLKWLEIESPDIIFIQETKLQPSQVNQRFYEHLGYQGYFHFAKQKGYSGVALLSKEKPDQVIMGMNNQIYDDEGRIIRADFGNLTLIGVYVPSGTMGGERQVYKMRFLDDFLDFLLKLREKRPNLIISGDFNICHKPIDINHPEKHQKSSGFLPEERKWFDKFLSCGFIDTLRVFNNMAEQYSWWSYRANSRAKNLGWRIDYHIVTASMNNVLRNAGILKDVMHSDHCPVTLEIEWNII